MPPVRSQSRGEPVTNLTTVQDFACANIEEAGYQLGRKLGEGRFSEVVLGKHLASGKEFAVKVVDQTALDEDEEASAALRIEVEVLQRAAKHPHVVALRSVIRTPAATYLVMDLMRGGELFDAIIDRGTVASPRGFPEDEARALLKQLLSALAYCHALGVVHRDLKPENILFEEEYAVGGTGALKIIDFGYAAQHRPGERLRGLSGTPDYVAPEVLSWYEGDSPESEPPPEQARLEYDASCDMWSVGVILFILLCGFPPFYAEGEAELIQRVREGHFEFTPHYWDDISASAKDLIARCLSLHPEERPTPTEALRHPWLTNEVAAEEYEEAPASAPPRESQASRGQAWGTSSAPAWEEDVDDEGDEDAEGYAEQERSGAPGAPGLQLTLEPSGPRVAAAPTREELQAQGATFVKVPRSLFQDIYALVEAQRRGELPAAGERPFSEVLQAVSAEVQRGALGSPEH